MKLTNKEMREILSQRAMDISMTLKYRPGSLLSTGETDGELYKKIEQLYKDSKKVLSDAD